MLLTNSFEGFEKQLTHAEKSPATIRSYIMTCKRFAEAIQSKYNRPVFLEQIQEEDIEEYLYDLKVNKGYKPSSINVTLNGLRNLFKYAMRNKFVEKDPTAYIETLKNHKERRDFLTVEEIQLLLSTMNHSLGNLVVRTLAFTGLRISECLALTMNDIDFDKNRVYVRNGKGNKPRTLPLSQDLKPYLIAYKNGPRRFIQDSDTFFATQKTGKISPVYINRLLKEATTELQWDKRVTCHTLRHSFASKLVKNGTGLPTVAALLGHSDFRTVTAVYVHVDESDLQDAVNQLSL